MAFHYLLHSYDSEFVGKNKDRLIPNTRNILEKRKVHIIKENCHSLINQLLAYSYMESSDKPRKENDDYVDGFILSVWPFRIVPSSQIYSELLDAGPLVDAMFDKGTHMDDVDVGGRGLFRRPFLMVKLPLSSENSVLGFSF